MIALGQALYAISTVYNARGDQVERFGYAAFGFTVIPYASMSLINLFANLLCPIYPTVFIVENEELRKLRARIALERMESSFFVEGVVGRIHFQVTDPTAMAWKYSKFGHFLGMFLLTAIYVCTVGGLSRFRSGDSTLAQRVWTLAWFSCSAFVGLIFAFLDWSDQTSTWAEVIFASLVFLSILASTVFSMGGLVVAGQMIMQKGICEKL